MSEPLLKVEIPEPTRQHIRLELLSPETHGASNDLLGTLRTVGQRDPITVEHRDGQLIIRDGNRRVEAAIKLGWPDIEAEVYERLSETQWALILAGVHNRANNPVAEARHFRHLSMTLTEKGISANTGVPVQTIRARLKLLSLPEDVLELIGSKHLSLGVAQEAAKLADAHLHKAVAGIRLAASEDRSFTAKNLKEITVARANAFGAALGMIAPPPQPLIPKAVMLASEVQELCTRRGVSLIELLAELQPGVRPLNSHASPAHAQVAS